MTTSLITDPVFLSFALPAVLIAGLSKGGFGAGAAFVATPLIALALPPHQAVGLMLPLLMVMDVTGLRAYWRRWNWHEAWPIMLGAVPGVAAAAYFFARTDPDAVRILIGVLALSFAAFQLAQSRGWRPPRALAASRGHGGFWGMVAGFTSFASHAGGPPVAIQLLSRGIDKTTYQATTVLIFWWINLVKVWPYAQLGLFTKDTMIAALWLAPVAVAGMLLGVWGHKHLPEKWYFIMVRTLLAITGCKLIWDGTTGLMG
ncbi:MAG: putative membrane protein YfcA [Paracoccaceae bacterium]|jgi:uncharacterized membrane protein YfcA